MKGKEVTFNKGRTIIPPLNAYVFCIVCSCWNWTTRTFYQAPKVITRVKNGRKHTGKNALRTFCRQEQQSLNPLQLKWTAMTCSVLFHNDPHLWICFIPHKKVICLWTLYLLPWVELCVEQQVVSYIYWFGSLMYLTNRACCTVHCFQMSKWNLWSVTCQSPRWSDTQTIDCIKWWMTCCHFLPLYKSEAQISKWWYHLELRYRLPAHAPSRTIVNKAQLSIWFHPVFIALTN